MSVYSESAMRAKISDCLKTVATVLDANKSHSIAAADTVAHKYGDKFLLANQLTNTSVVAVLNSLEKFGMSSSTLATLQDWNGHREVSLKFERKQRCKFVKEIEREVEDPTRFEIDGLHQTTVKMITKVKEFVYQVKEKYTLMAISGVDHDGEKRVKLVSQSGEMEAVFRNKCAPFKESTVDVFDVNISWLLKHLDGATSTATFSIDRTHVECATPRRNLDVTAALHFFASFSSFCDKVRSNMRCLYEVQTRFSAATTAKFDLTTTDADDVFNPILPLFEDVHHHTIRISEGESTVADNDDVEAATTTAALTDEVVTVFATEQRRSLDAACSDIDSMLSSKHSGVFGTNEAKLMLVMSHLSHISEYFKQGVDFIEHMLRQQLVAAVGKELTARDFAQYMTFHNRKVFKETYQPQPFSYAVRRSPVHSPEGQIQIETVEVIPAEPIFTVSQHTENAPHMEFALNATTTVKFGGERHLHGWMAHRFSGQALPELKLVAEARQFSSYIVLIGRIASAKLFQPKYGFIVQNKDEFRIPLDLEQIPTAKEFKDAISSLSPEQQRFAKAFRSMQLESTLFGVCVIQIKPQLEKVLKLQADSLTKEIKLTQDLMQLFIKYQIPSDLLSFDAEDPEVASRVVLKTERVLGVKRNVQAMQEVVLSEKEEELAEKRLLREYNDDHHASQGSHHVAGWAGRGGGRAGRGYGCSAGGRGGRGGAGRGGWNALLDSTSFSDFGTPHRYIYAHSEVTHCAVPPAMVAKAIDSLDVRRAPPNFEPEKVTSSYKPKPLSRSDVLASVRDSLTVNQVDYTQYPSKLEEMYTRYDPDSSLRPTIINPGATWTKRAQAGLLSAPQTTSLSADLQASEKSAAFDLLDALTRSGGLPIEHASLHVIIAATHCFDQSLMDTVVQKNVNPIERVERSTLIMATALNDVPAAELITVGQLDRVRTFSPMLFEHEEQAALE